MGTYIANDRQSDAGRLGEIALPRHDTCHRLDRFDNTRAFAIFGLRIF
jgi:hypothetical protein